MQLTAEQRHRLNSATVLTLNGGCGPFIVSSLVLGSGILPIRYDVLLLTRLLVGVAATIPLFAFGLHFRRFKLLATGTILSTAIGSAAIFMYFQSSGLEHAKRYGETWVAAIETTRDQRGQWPSSINDALSPPQPIAPRLPWPYLASCRDESCKVAGYFVAYELREGKPHLLIARRDIRLEWNWAMSTWRELPSR